MRRQNQNCLYAENRTPLNALIIVHERLLNEFLGLFRIFLSRSFGIPMFKLRSIAARLILAISLTVAVACGILGTFSIIQQRALTQLALEQQLKL